MGFYHFDSHNRLVDTNGVPKHVVGLNYIASYVCTDFWADWRPDRIEQDLKGISALGLNAVRIPMQWCSMEPEEGQYSPVFEEEFAAFIGMCKKYGLSVMPWFLVGVATKLYDIPYRRGRSILSEEMTVAAENLFKHFTALYKDDESILFWDICDEPEFFADLPGSDPTPYDREKFANWVKRMYDAIHSVDKNHLVTLGFGGIGNTNYGMDVRDMAKILDFMAVTAYPRGICSEGIDAARNNYTLAYHVKMNTRSCPMFTCESPGYSNVWAGERQIGRYYKVSLYSNALCGSTGALPWAYNDFEESLWHNEPLEIHVAEPYYGIKTVDGRLKPNGQELRNFAAFAKKAELGRYRPQKAEAAIVIPEGYYANVNTQYVKAFTALALATGTGVAVDFVWTSEDLSPYKFLILPNSTGMTTAQWDKLRRYVQDGGTLYFEFEGHRSCSVYLNELCGVEMEHPNQGCGYRSITAERDWGIWKKGEEVELVGGDGNVIRLHLDGAEPLFTFADGEPALMRHAYGKGTCFLAAEQFDNGIMQIMYDTYLSSPSFDLYRAMAEEAGIHPLVSVNNNAVETGLMTDPDTGDRLVLAVNHDNRALDAVLTLDPSLLNGTVVRDFDTDEVVTTNTLPIHLEGAGVHVYKITSEK